MGAPDATCEMCEKEDIRFVHHMAHENYPDVLACGCICAGHMEEDYAAARLRDKNMRNRAGRRSSWPRRAGWRLSKAGNWTIREDGYQLTIIGAEGQYRVALARPFDGGTVFGKRVFGTLHQAKLASFDALAWARGDWHSRRKKQK